MYNLLGRKLAQPFFYDEKELFGVTAIHFVWEQFSSPNSFMIESSFGGDRILFDAFDTFDKLHAQCPLFTLRSTNITEHNIYIFILIHRKNRTCC